SVGVRSKSVRSKTVADLDPGASIKDLACAAEAFEARAAEVGWRVRTGTSNFDPDATVTCPRSGTLFDLLAAALCSFPGVMAMTFELGATLRLCWRCE